MLLMTELMFLHGYGLIWRVLVPICEQNLTSLDVDGALESTMLFDPHQFHVVAAGSTGMFDALFRCQIRAQILGDGLWYVGFGLHVDHQTFGCHIKCVKHAEESIAHVNI